MIRGTREQSGQRGGRALHARLPDVAEHVDRRRCQVGRAHASRDDQHALPLLGETEGGHKAGETGADDDRVVTHAGRCSTSSTP
jgi:hypothetical protein